VTQNPNQQAYCKSTRNGELVISSKTISSHGFGLLPMLILSAILHLHDWYMKTDWDNDVLTGVSGSEDYNDSQTLCWLMYFEKLVAR